MNDPEASQEYNADAVGMLDANTNLGQSFISRRPNLNGITLWLTPSAGQSNETGVVSTNNITIKLFQTPGESTPVYSTSINAPASGNNVPITINIPNQKNPGGQYYYLLLSIDSGTIQVNGRNEDAYPYGQAYLNENATNADLAFRLSYSYDLPALIQDVKQFIAYSWIIIPLLILVWLPGCLLLNLSGFRSHFDFGEGFAIEIGLSLALIPLVMLWTTILKIKWSRQGVLFVAGFLVALLVIQLIYGYLISKRIHPKSSNNLSDLQSVSQTNTSKYGLIKPFALILIFLGSLAIRMIMVRDLATPAWVDSVHHALITRQILTAGAFPSSYLPFLDISPSAYHPGFHSIAAIFTWLTNLDLAKSLLILGQVLNALCVFSVYLFTTTLTRRSTAGLVAAFITGFLTPMPAYYTSWGRYTELTGLLILPVVLSLINLWLDEKTKKSNIWTIFLVAITAGGLFMVHYRVIAFLAALIFSFVLYQVLFKRNATYHSPVHLLISVSIMAVISIIFVFPWFIQTVKTILALTASPPATTSIPLFQDFSWPFLTSALGKQAMVMAGLGILWSVIKRHALAFIISVWVLILFFLANLYALKLPGGGLISNQSVEIMLFIPISILGGYFIDQILSLWGDLLSIKFTLPAIGIICLLFGYVAYLGARQLIPILNPVTILSRNADLPAIEWVSEHIPENETLVINPFAWGYGLYAGNDGGYWISPLSGRLTLPPPVLYGLGSNVNQINQRTQELMSVGTDPSKLWGFLNSQQIHYVFIGVKGGLIPPEKLISSGLFDVLYHQDGDWIFRVIP